MQYLVEDREAQIAARESRLSIKESRENWGPEHGENNIKHNNAIEDELDSAVSKGAKNISKNRVQMDANGNRVYTPKGNYVKPDASYTLNRQRNNINFVSNYQLNNSKDLTREIEAFNRMCEADPSAKNILIFQYK